MKRISESLAAIVALIVAPGCASGTSNTKTNDSTEITMNDAQNAIGGLDVRKYTSAPVRVRATADLDEAQSEIWSYVSNNDNLLEYTNGSLKHAEVDRSASDGADGVGTKRHCETPDGGRFVEDIVYFRAPYVFAYQLTENTWGLSDHLAVVSLSPKEGGGTRLVWEVYFNHPDEDTMSKNMTGMFKTMIMPFFTKKFGGTVHMDG